MRRLSALVLSALGACAAAAAPTPATWIPGTLEIHHVYVGQGDSVLVVSPSGRTMLFDAGERDWYLHENAELIAAYVEKVTGKRQIDTVVLSHFHQDHVGNSKTTEDGAHYDGGIFWLLKTHALEVRKVVDRGFTPLLPNTPIADKYKAFAESAEGRTLLRREPVKLGKGQIDLGPGVDVTAVAANGRVLGKDGREVVLLSDEKIRATPPPSENDLSICLTIRWGEFEYFIGGDLSGQDFLSPFGYEYHDMETGVAPAVGNVEVYRADHHGSDHSSNKTLVEKLDPEVSIVSAGTANRFGHPRQPVVEELLSTGDLFVTAREGGACSSHFGRAAEGGTVVVRAYNGGYNYDVAVVRSYRSFSDDEEARHADRAVDYELQQVRYEEASGARPPDDEEDGSKAGDVKAGGGPGHSASAGAASAAAVPLDPEKRAGIACIRAKDHAKLAQAVGQRACVWGRVTSTFTPASNKVKFINIDTEDLASSFTLVIFAKDWPSFLETQDVGDPAKFYRDKWVCVVGRLEAAPDRGGAAKGASAKIELVVKAPHEIEVLPFRKEAPAAPAPAH